MNLTEHCLKKTYAFKNSEVDYNNSKSESYTDVGSEKRDFNEIHDCVLPYTEYEAMLMFFKYYKAQKEDDIKHLELNVLGKL